MPALLKSMHCDNSFHATIFKIHLTCQKLQQREEFGVITWFHRVFVLWFVFCLCEIKKRPTDAANGKRSAQNARDDHSVTFPTDKSKCQFGSHVDLVHLARSESPASPGGHQRRQRFPNRVLSKVKKKMSQMTAMNQN